MFSMTGYGKAGYNENGINLSVEIRSVNNRILDLNIKAPKVFLSMESSIRRIVAEYINRGKIDVFINFSDKRKSENLIFVDEEKALAYFDAAAKISSKTGLPNDCTVSFLLRCPDVIVEEDILDEEEFLPIITDTVKNACNVLNDMRKAEGEKLCEDLMSRISTIENLVSEIQLRAPKVVSVYRDKLKERIQEALRDVDYDEARLLNEVAFYSDKVNIDEEITRLVSHIKQFRNIIKVNGSGKKLDFLMQEFNREANTVCSKSNDIIVTKFALELKNEIEKVREQVQNLE